ncbi:carboxypeptidase-like regulatory domain-containing protein [Methanocella sp. MCL-LM]|uniref:carboxypeptidase-like regulatory domain-containing protein n=1 Tax=Methanocella sp. MCL-LM TaxID=3412035 RepID=UPI003C760138
MKPFTVILLVTTALMLLVVTASAFSLAQTPTLNASISGRVSSSIGTPVTDAQVMLVNASNTSEQIGNFTMTVDKDGNYQFVNVPMGNVSVFAWSPNYASSLSNSLAVSEKVTYTANVVLIPEPYFVDITVSQKVIPLETGKSTITFTVYDHWMNKVGAGWFITTHTTAGTLDPLYGDTDTNSQFKTTISAPMEGTNATVDVFAKAKNGTYYPLQMVEVTPTPAPAVTPTATAVPNATVQVTVTPVANATATPIITATPEATPTAAPTPTPTPGFEIVAALIGLAVVAAAYKKA